jgi:glutamine synthetase
MDLLEKVARRHNFRVLMHEKPFAGINGSGKHNNWSLATNTGTNLLSPGKTPKRNLQFLTFFVNAIVAVDRHADLLRASIASASNDHRLGANEAPPAIISVFLGQQLSAVLDELEKVESGKLSPEQKTELKLNVVGKIPEILLDNTDRNRTSPFAFTGNKFEFRAVGSSANCAQSMTVLNTIVANQLFEFKKSVDSLIEQGLKKDDALFNVLRDLISTSHKVRFEGDGYSEDWKNEAAKRGLSNLPDTPRALKAYVSESSKALFEKLNILNHIELEARYDILLEDYFKKIQIESRTLGDLVTNHILPTVMAFQAQVADGALKLKSLYDEKTFAKLAKPQLDLVTELGNRINILSSEVNAMTEARKVANKIHDTEARAIAYCDTVKPHFETIRYHVDKLELSVDNALWPLPKYREMLYAR